jgi:hypothetical protein
MNKVKYQIFVSSTYEDLKEEREQVIKACLEMGHIPVGMEMFSAADEEQWQIITRQIDESDYYVIIVANRYGSMVDGISYTEKEYDYAISKGVPTLGFVLDAIAGWPSNRSETVEEARPKLEAFKQKVRRKPVNFWSSKEDLHGKCSIALMKTFNTQPRPGWVRSPDTMGHEVAEELSRLSSENNNLREENAQLKKAGDTSSFAQGDDKVELLFTIVLPEPGGANEYGVKIATTWNELFRIIAQKMLDRQDQPAIMTALGDYFKEKALIALDPAAYGKVSEMFKDNTSIYTEESDARIIKIQFVALGLIKISHSGMTPLWTLTPEGEYQYIQIAAQKRT